MIERDVKALCVGGVVAAVAMTLVGSDYTTEPASSIDWVHAALQHCRDACTALCMCCSDP